MKPACLSTAIRSVCCFLILATSLAAQDTSSWLHCVDNNIYRGKQPTQADIPLLAAAGIKTVLDLRGPLDHKHWEKQAVEATGMRYVRVGLSGFFAPTKAQMAKILKVLDDPDAGPIYIHCRRGDDRSGVVVACYRIVHYKWTNQQALDEASKVGISRFEILMRRFIRNFHAPSTPEQGESR